MIAFPLVMIGIILTMVSFRSDQPIDVSSERAHPQLIAAARATGVTLVTVVAILLLLKTGRISAGDTRVYYVLLFQVLLSLAPFVARTYRWRRRLLAISATLMSAFCVIGGFSIGLFFIPSAGLLLIAAATEPTSVATV